MAQVAVTMNANRPDGMGRCYVCVNVTHSDGHRTWNEPENSCKRDILFERSVQCAVCTKYCISSSVLLDPDNMGIIAVGMSLLSCIQAEIILYFISISGYRPLSLISHSPWLRTLLTPSPPVTSFDNGLDYIIPARGSPAVKQTPDWNITNSAWQLHELNGVWATEVDEDNALHCY